LIKVNQHQFYDEVRSLVDHWKEVSANDIKELDDLHLNFYRAENDELQKVVRDSKHRDMDMPSLLNMLREINNSNEAILYSLQLRLGIA
jgi:hypothetical protein